MHDSFAEEKSNVHLVVSLPQHPQNGKEQVEDVQIQSDGCPNVLIIGKALDQVLGVINNVP